MDYIRDEHRVHLIAYHLIWCPKRRKKILVDNIAKDCEELIKLKCQKQGWTVLSIAIQPDHVHLFIRVYPTIAAVDVVKECKGATSYELRTKYPELKKIPSMWTRSYFASTAGNVSSSVIQNYIEAQSTL